MTAIMIQGEVRTYSGLYRTLFGMRARSQCTGSGSAVLLHHSTDVRKTLLSKPPGRLRLSSASARSSGQARSAVTVRAQSTSSTSASSPGRSPAVAWLASSASSMSSQARVAVVVLAGGCGP